ncbi:MAG: energy transducer TonB [Nannocystis sp.]|uniref:TonB-dependent receptor n=1 Tax=Nannocystis sp. TaxID=1962667 RepID=UPI0024246E7D|nr:energy transducer TonB [Nannocystis sp.]MBK9752869.1 energy transducer TonB [Nannocystis sp.]
MSLRTPTALLALALVVAPSRAAAQAPVGYEAPVLRDSLAITYPPALLALPKPPAGRIELKFVVGVDGAPREIEVTRGLHPELDAAALAALAQLRYQPGLLRGRPVEVVLALALDIRAPEASVPSDSQIQLSTPVPSDSPPADITPVASDSPPADAPVRLRGRVLSAGQRTPVANASVLVVPADPSEPVGRVRKRRYGDDPTPAWTMRAVTDAAGNFTLRAVPSGKLRIVVLVQGYERLEYVERLAADEQLTLAYYPTPLVFNPYKTVVKARRDDSGEVDRRTITPEEISKLPGTQGDALKSLQNFPGVARAPFGAGLLVIRGAAPSDSATFLGYHEIPQLFHFGGLTSVFNADILTQIDFIPGNFDSRFGDAIGGVINVAPRKGRRDGFHGYVKSDVFDTGILAEGPIGKGSLIVAGRRSYIDAILPAVVPKDAGLDFTVAPRYYDYQLLFDYPISGGEFSARVFGSDDRSKLLFAGKNDTDTSNNNGIETIQFFHRADLVYRKQLGPWEFLVTPSYRRDDVSFLITDAFRFHVVTDTFSGRAELSRQLSRNFGLRVGTEFVATAFDLSLTAAARNPGAAGAGSLPGKQSSENSSTLLRPALYITTPLRLGERLTLFPGARLTYYGLPFTRPSLEPRLRATFDVADNTTLKAGVGLYAQTPQPREFDAVFGNPRVGLEHALHTSLGVAQALPRDITLEVTGFYKSLWDLARPSSTLQIVDGSVRPETAATTGRGYVVGGELLLRKALTRNLFAWLSYTLMRSVRRDAAGEPAYLFNFDQTHILTAIASYKLPRNWQIGARFRLISGNPYTPVIGAVFDAGDGSYIAVQGPRNSARLPPFHQLDLRVDKRWIFRRVALNAFLDVLNIYNHVNTERLQNAYNFQGQSPVASLPIVPSIGLRLEW